MDLSTMFDIYRSLYLKHEVLTLANSALYVGSENYFLKIEVKRT